MLALAWSAALAAAAPHAKNSHHHVHATTLAKPVACSAQQTPGTCIKAAELFGSYNDSAATAADCCAQCKKYSFQTPQSPGCMNYTFNDTAKRCSLHSAAVPIVNGADCHGQCTTVFLTTLQHTHNCY